MVMMESMEWKNVASSSMVLTDKIELNWANQFWQAVDIWMQKPQVVNKRLCGAIILARIGLKCRRPSSKEFGFYQQLKQKVEENLDDLESAFNDLELNHEDEIELIVRDVLPKQSDKCQTIREVVILDKKMQEIIYFPISNIRDSSGDIYMQSYMVKMIDGSSDKRIEISVNSGEHIVPHVHHTASWLKDVLLPKLLKWMNEGELQNLTNSLQLVALDHYNSMYQNLKVKYGKDLVQSWCESTDPQKFVYEELAIASYLMVLFEEEEQKCGKKQTFVDLGCGNGLLVYVLANEGYTGIGIDVRKRKIWDTYGPNVHLKECAIKPSAGNLFKEYDWIIGNHSDELTPWIPVIAARSSYNCKYFVLPCCPHDFNHKFNERKAGCSLYQAYLQYVAQIGEKCGFHVERDTLRIPSTKRVCFVGRTRTYSVDAESVMDRQLQSYINERCDSSSEKQNSLSDNSRPVSKKFKSSPDDDDNAASLDDWAVNFTPRESVEKVRNCTTVDRGLQDLIVDRVFKTIIKHENRCDLQDGRKWNKGASIELSQVAKLFDKSCLVQLKKECGGIQTLLRNQHQIFAVIGGKVQLKSELKERPKQKNKFSKNPELFLKTKLCWFNDHHPDGCPRVSENCLFAHGNNELRTLNLVNTET
ncbi:putative tRNA (uracil-O(2)-)-methyltransferase [Tubulanus polymorphus]|uniref:putative tRNA (uracil-O(2)-)-methyltransferase n=1 Tax=Tubulanus polymorphus TaxID=672921 RepID=UPI003DA45C06